MFLGVARPFGVLVNLKLINGQTLRAFGDIFLQWRAGPDSHVRPTAGSTATLKTENKFSV
jgi:hypothetical protein